MEQVMQKHWTQVDDWRRIELQSNLPSQVSPKVSEAGRDTYDVQLHNLSYQEVRELADYLRGKVTA